MPRLKERHQHQENEHIKRTVPNTGRLQRSKGHASIYCIWAIGPEIYHLENAIRNHQSFCNGL